MAYVISPYAQPAVLPRDNTGAQLASEIAKSGYARRMKEMEQKMKLKEEGKKKLDEAYKYAKLDLSKVHPIYQNELLSESNAVTKEAAEAFLKDPTTFAYDTEIADKIGKLNTKKSIYEQRSAVINKEEEAKRQLEKEGKFDVIPTEFGNLMNEYTNPETSPETKKEIESKWRDKFTDAYLYTPKLRVAPYTWDDVAQEVKNLKPQTDIRKITYPQKETVVATVINDPNKKASLAAQAGIDLTKPEGEKELIKRLENYMSESEKPAPQGRGYDLMAMKEFSKPEPGKIDFKMTTETNKGMQLYPSSVVSPAVFSFSTAFPTTLVQPSGSYNIETGKSVNKEKDFEDNKMYEVALSNVAILPVYKKGTTRKGGVDVSYEIVDDENLKDPRLKDKIEYGVYAIGQGGKEISLGSRGKQTITRDVYIPINQVKDAVWDKLASTEKSSVMENINDMKNKALELNKKLKSSTTSAPKESERKETNESKKKPTLSDALKAFEEKFKRKPSETELNKLKLKYK